MFRYAELLNLDVRDIAFWLRAARRKILFDQIRHIQAVRAGMASDEYYRDRIGELRAQINEVDHREVIDQNWEDLKALKSGRI